MAKVKLLKLHGSANWSICRSRQHVTVHPRATPIAVVESCKCDKCSEQMEPFIVPPTWSKGEHRSALESVWKAAFDELVSARRWIFIGSSLPETDRFLRFMFGLALQKNTQLDRIVIINRDESGYDQLFKEHASKIEVQSMRDIFERDIMQGSRFAIPLGQYPFNQVNPLW